MSDRNKLIRFIIHYSPIIWHFTASVADRVVKQNDMEATVARHMPGGTAESHETLI
jgi:hypothetical protein